MCVHKFVWDARPEYGRPSGSSGFRLTVRQSAVVRACKSHSARFADPRSSVRKAVATSSKGR